MFTRRIGLAVALVVTLALSSFVMAASVDPVYFEDWQSGNAEFECNQAGDCCSESDDSYKFESWTAGERSFGPISITNNDGKNFDWSSTSPVSCVIVVRGNIANVYYYCPDGAYGDTELTGPEDFEISHVTFCYSELQDFELLNVSKTAETSFTREHFWDIDKSVGTEQGYELDDVAKIWLYIDGEGDETATWTVEVTYLDFEDSDFNVSGTITIENTGTLDAVITGIDDVLAGMAIDVNCGEDFEFPYTLEVDDILTCTYSEDGYVEGANVVTVTTERDEYTADAPIFWGDPTTEINETVNIQDISDLFGTVTLGSVTAPNGDTFTYDEDFAWEDYGADNCGSFQYDNTATIVETDQSASAKLKVNIQCFIYDSAWAKGDPNVPFCDYFANWGWTNIIEPGTYEWPLWAGAGQCDTSKGTLVGTVTVVYDADTFVVTVTFNVDAPYILDETHVYAGTTMFPQMQQGRRGMVDTVAPGQYYIEDDLSGEIYVIAHAVVGIPDPDFGP